MPTNPGTKNAASDAMRTSHAQASDSPAPAHAPLTAAMTGFSSARMARTFGWYVARRLSLTSGASPNSFRSWPAQNPRPAPVMTTARTSGSRASFSASRSAPCSARLNAFITSGRLSVIVWTAPARVTSTSVIRETLRHRRFYRRSTRGDSRRSDAGERAEVSRRHLVAEEHREPARAEVLQQRHVLRSRVVVVDADDRMDFAERPSRPLRVRDREVGAIARVLVVVRLRQEIEAAVSPRGEVDRQHVRRLGGAERDERSGNRRLHGTERAHEVRGALPADRPALALVRRLRVRDVEVEAVQLQREVGDGRAGDGVGSLHAPDPHLDAVRLHRWDPRRVGPVECPDVIDVHCQPGEVRSLEPPGDRLRIREVLRVVGEEADAGEHVRGCVGARHSRGRKKGRRKDGHSSDPTNHALVVRLERNQRPVKSGFRFSRNAFRPSPASSDARARKNERRSSSTPAASGVSKAWSTASLARRTAIGPFAAISRATPFASSSHASLATTRATSPCASASRAESMRPVRIMSIAIALPTARVRGCVPPAPGRPPRLISGWPNAAVSEATIRSQSIASSQPPPRQKPDTAATIGVRTFRIASHRSRRRFSYSVTGVASASSPMSAPAAKARSPPPRTIARISGSASSSPSAATTASISSPE